MKHISFKTSTVKDWLIRKLGGYKTVCTYKVPSTEERIQVTVEIPREIMVDYNGDENYAYNCLANKLAEAIMQKYPKANVKRSYDSFKDAYSYIASMTVNFHNTIEQVAENNLEEED